MSSDMHRELDSTRAELRNTILQAHQQTADTASHMRRVIVVRPKRWPSLIGLPRVTSAPSTSSSPEVAHQAQAASGGGRGGWLSDLLTRAFRGRRAVARAGREPRTAN